MTGDSSQSRNHGDRDHDGRFRPGNRVSVGVGGNPRAKMTHEIYRAIAAAATPEAVLAVLEALHVRALAGDSNAATCWLMRVCGPARTTVQVELPTIASAGDAATAARSVLEHVAAGAASLEEGQRLIELVGHVRDAVVLAELEQRIAQLERGGAL
jgi:hypothetical protein